MVKFMKVTEVNLKLTTLLDLLNEMYDNDNLPFSCPSQVLKIPLCMARLLV